MVTLLEIRNSLRTRDSLPKSAVSVGSSPGCPTPYPSQCEVKFHNYLVVLVASARMESKGFSSRTRTFPVSLHAEIESEVRVRAGVLTAFPPVGNDSFQYSFSHLQSPFQNTGREYHFLHNVELNAGNFRM